VQLCSKPRNSTVLQAVVRRRHLRQMQMRQQQEQGTLQNVVKMHRAAEGSAPPGDGDATGKAQEDRDTTCQAELPVQKKQRPTT
jgi:hypothetical protein